MVSFGGSGGELERTQDPIHRSLIWARVVIAHQKMLSRSEIKRCGGDTFETAQC